MDGERGRTVAAAEGSPVGEVLPPRPGLGASRCLVPLQSVQITRLA
jgi:hypothetical protein